MPEKFYYGYEEQDLLLACLCRHPQKFTVIGPLIQPEYMWGLDATRLMGFLQDHHGEYSYYPTFQGLTAYIQDKCGREKAGLFNDCAKFIAKLRKVTTRDVDMMAAITLKFCKERALIAAITKGAELIKEGKIPAEGLGPMMDKARAVGEDVNNLGICYVEDVRGVVKKLTDATWGVKTGYGWLDKQWRNGWGPGWLIVPLAPPKSYKSTFCMNLALNMTTKKINYDPIPVFYYACEISAELSCARGYCLQSGQKFGEMYDNPERFIATTEEAMIEDFDGPDAGQLLVKTFPSKAARISDIRVHAKMARETFGLNPRAIFIDHAETILPGDRVKTSSDHRQQADIYTEARALGEEFQCCVIMPDRCNKETVQHAVPSMTSFQGAFQKAGEVDVAIGLCQTPEEKLTKQIRYFIFLNRHGKAYGYFGGNIDDETFKMSIDTELKFEDEIQKAKDADAARNNHSGGGGSYSGAFGRIRKEERRSTG